jgi:uncharacterized integral membrane protein
MENNTVSALDLSVLLVAFAVGNTTNKEIDIVFGTPVLTPSIAYILHGRRFYHFRVFLVCHRP